MAQTKPKIYQVDTGITAFNDPITVLHQGASSANVDVGFLFNRANGLVSNVALYWSESANSFVTSFTTNSGVTNSNITATGYANLTIGSLLSINGNIYLNGVMGTAGQYITATSSGTAWTSAPFIGGYVANQSTFGANLVANSGTASTSITTGALVVNGGTGISGALYITNTGDVSANIGSLLANAGTQGASINSINANVGAFELYANANLGTATNNISTLQANVGAFETYANTKIGTNNNSNLVVVSTTTSTSYTTGALVVNGGAGVSGNINAGGYGSFSGTYNESSTTAGVYAGIAGSVPASPRTGFFNGNASQNWQIDNYNGTFRWFTPGTTRMTLDGNTGQLVVGNNISSGTLNVTTWANIAGPLAVTNNTSVQAIQVVGTATKGGVGYHDFLLATNQGGGTNPNKSFRLDSVGALQIINSAYTTNIFNLDDGGNLTIPGKITISNGVFWANGVAYSSGGGTTFTGGYIPNQSTFGANLVANSATTSTSTTTGALVVVGGIGVSGNVYAGQVYSTNNGNGTNFAIGDDAWLGDINVANTTRLMGQQDGTQGYLVFGNTNTTNYIGRTGSSPITVTGAFAITGNTDVQNTLYGRGVYDNSNRVVSTSTGAGNLAISGTAINLTATGPGAVSTGSSTAIPVVTTDAYGRISTITTAAVIAPAGTLSGTTLNSGVTASSLTSVGTLVSLNVTNVGDVSANIGTLYANAGTQGASINSINANVGAFELYANANLGTATTNITSLQANIGAFHNYANTKIGTNTNSNLVVVSTTPSTSTTTGAMVVGGGVGIAGNLYVGGNLTVSNVIYTNTEVITTTEVIAGNLVLTSADDTISPTTGALVIPTGGLSVGGNAYVGHNLYVGSGAFNLSLTAPTIFAVDNGTAYTQMAMQNIAGTGSADFAAYGDNSTESSGWADMGFAGSSFNDSNYTITGPGDGYFIVEGTNNTIGGNLILATGSTGYFKDIIFGTGGFDQASIVGRFHGNATNAGYFSVETNAGAINTLSGALRVTGGAGFTENVYADKFYTVNGLYWAGNGVAFSSGSTYSNTNVAAYLTSQNISSANIGTLYLGNISTNANLGTATTNISSLQANIGAYHQYANANLGTATTNISSLQANIGAFELYANANIGTLYNGNISTNANLGAFQTYANATFATTGGPSTTVISANLGAYQTWANASISSLATNANANTVAYLNKNSISNITVAGQMVVSNITQSVSETTGALVVSGGVGIGKDLHVLGEIHAENNTQINGNLTIAGNIIFTGNATNISTDNLAIQDSIINLHTFANLAPWTINDGRDIGMAMHYYDTEDKLAFLGRANDTGYLEFYANGKEGTGNTFVSSAYGTFKTGEFVVANTTPSTSNVTGALRVNGGIGVTGNIYVSSNVYIAGVRALTTSDLAATTFTANYITQNPLSSTALSTIAGTSTSYGTYNFGNVQSIQIYGDYDTVANTGFYSVNDATGSPAHVEYIGFTNVSTFNQLDYNINYTAASGHTINIDLYNYQYGGWDTFATYSGSGSWQTFTLGLINAAPYIGTTVGNVGNVTTRLYHVSSGNAQHRTWIDYVALQNTLTGSQGPRGATGATGASGTYTGGYVSGITTFGSNLVANSGTSSTSTTTGAIVSTGGAGIAGNVYADKFYTTSGLYWSGNGAAFASGTSGTSYATGNVIITNSTGVLPNIYTSIGSINSSYIRDDYLDENTPRREIMGTFPYFNIKTINGAYAYGDLAPIQIYDGTSIPLAQIGFAVTNTNAGDPTNSATKGGSFVITASNAAVTTANINGDFAVVTNGQTRFRLKYDGRAYILGNTSITGNGASTSTTTGALVVAGGAGINGNVWAGNLITANGVFWANGAVYSTGSSSPGGGLTDVQVYLQNMFYK